MSAKPSGEETVGAAAGERDPEHVVRGRPGRRTVEERQQAVLELLSGKASVDQLARRLGVLPETVEGWRADALGGVAEALRRGSGKTDRERELERAVAHDAGGDGDGAAAVPDGRPMPARTRTSTPHSRGTDAQSDAPSY